MIQDKNQYALGTVQMIDRIERKLGDEWIERGKKILDLVRKEQRKMVTNDIFFPEKENKKNKPIPRQRVVYTKEQMKIILKHLSRGDSELFLGVNWLYKSKKIDPVSLFGRKYFEGAQWENIEDGGIWLKEKSEKKNWREFPPGIEKQLYETFPKHPLKGKIFSVTIAMMWIRWNKARTEIEKANPEIAIKGFGLSFKLVP